MLSFKKEKKVVKLVRSHLELVESCVLRCGQALEQFIRGESAEAGWKEVDHLESQADEVRREILEKMYSGAYLPLIREDIHNLVERIDRVANAAEECCDHFLTQRPLVPEEFCPPFIEIVRASIATIEPLRIAVSTYFEPKGKIETVRTYARQVGEQESLVDAKETELTIAIFDSGLGLAEKLQLRRCVSHIVEIADRAEDATDQLELVSMKSIV